MQFDNYQRKAHLTASYPDIFIDFDKDSDQEAFYIYPTLGLVGEAGEVAEKMKKCIRNKKGRLTKEDIYEIGKEIGDVLWYCAELASVLGLSLNDIAEYNLEKLKDRQERGVIKSQGDNR